MMKKSKPADFDMGKNKPKTQNRRCERGSNNNNTLGVERRPRNRGNFDVGHALSSANDVSTTKTRGSTANGNVNGSPLKNKISESNRFGTGIPQLDDQLMQLAKLNVQPSKVEDSPDTSPGQTRASSTQRYSPSKQPPHPPLNRMKLRCPSVASMTLVVQRVNLVDGWKSPLLLGCFEGISEEEAKKKEQQLLKQQHNAAFILPPNSILAQDIRIEPLSFSMPEARAEMDGKGKKDVEDDFFDSFGGPLKKNINTGDESITIAYAPVISSSFEQELHQKNMLQCTVTPTTLVSVQNESSTPFADTEQYEKYWAQRKRLFSRFDEGIQMGDAQGWYSVTPEAIADHVARRMGEKACQYDKPMVLLDAFCGCGGNAIAFGKLSPCLVSLIVCCDISLDKLRNAANNAAVYGIPHDKLIFIHHDSLYIMSQCYKEGTLQLPSEQCHHHEKYFLEQCKGYTIGNSLVDLLPLHIDAIFIDPPWGGVDYVVMGGKFGYDLSKDMKLLYGGDPPTKEANGFDIVAMAAMATQRKIVMYDVPKNTNKHSLAKAALFAGYRGNIKLEEYYLNGRLKTATAFLGWDYDPRSSTRFQSGRNIY